MPRKDSGTSPRPKYDLPAPNAGLPYRGGLAGLCRDDAPPSEARRAEPLAFTAAAGDDTWLDPRRLERDLDADPRLRALLDELAAALPEAVSPPWLARAFARIERHVDRVFADATLPAIAAQFAAVKHLVLQYALAKAAARVAHPRRFAEDEEGDRR